MTLFQALLALLAILQIADVLSTNAALKRPGIRETKWLMARIQALLGGRWWLGKLAIAAVWLVCLWYLSTFDEMAATILAALFAAYYARIVWKNVRNARA